MPVTVVVRSVSGKETGLEGVKFVEMDIHEPPAEAFFRIGSPGILVHLAWGGLNDCMSSTHVENELPKQYRFLRGMVTTGLKNVVVAGTCYEYGMQSGPLDEACDARPITPYGIAKDALRRQLEHLKQSHDFNLTWAKWLYMFGLGQAENALQSQLRRAVEHGEKMFNISGGEQLRDYLPVEDVANTIVQLAIGRTNHGGVNVCSGKPVSVRTRVEGWLRENGWSIELNLGHYPYREYEPMAFWGVTKNTRVL